MEPQEGLVKEGTESLDKQENLQTLQMALACFNCLLYINISLHSNINSIPSHIKYTTEILWGEGHSNPCTICNIWSCYFSYIITNIVYAA